MINFAWFFLGMFTGTVLSGIAMWADRIMVRAAIRAEKERTP